MATPSLYVTRLLAEPVMAEIRTRFHLLSEPDRSLPTRADLTKGFSQAQAAICTLTERIDRDILEHAPQLKVIANHAVGYNNIDVSAAAARGVVVTNTPDVLTEATADLTWALLLAAARRIPEGHALAQTGGWTGWEPTQLLGSEVSGQTLGIVGMGRIGQAVARRAAGFKMPVLYCRKGRQSIQSPDSSWREAAFEELLERADFITLHVPLTPETRHLIGGDALSRMRPTAYLINTSRGPVVDEAALAAALSAGRLAGAGLDVYEDEPKIHPGLLGLPHVVTLPHVGSATVKTRVKMGMMCVENVLAVLEGRPAPNRVN
jgi:glyoxylate reductase